MKFEIKRPVLTKQQYEDPESDKSLLITGLCEKIKLIFSQNDFRFLMKLLDLNLSYDDQMEPYICPTTDLISRQITKINRGGVFFSLNMCIEMLSILLNHGTQEIAELF